MEHVGAPEEHEAAEDEANAIAEILPEHGGGDDDDVGRRSTADKSVVVDRRLLSGRLVSGTLHLEGFGGRCRELGAVAAMVWSGLLLLRVVERAGRWSWCEFGTPTGDMNNVYRGG